MHFLSIFNLIQNLYKRFFKIENKRPKNSRINTIVFVMHFCHAPRAFAGKHFFFDMHVRRSKQKSCNTQNFVLANFLLNVQVTRQLN